MPTTYGKWKVTGSDWESEGRRKRDLFRTSKLSNDAGVVPGDRYHCAGFQRTAPSSFPGPDSCAKATTRRLSRVLEGFSFTCTSWAKPLPLLSFPIFAIC